MNQLQAPDARGTRPASAAPANDLGARSQIPFGIDRSFWSLASCNKWRQVMQGKALGVSAAPTLSEACRLNRETWQCLPVSKPKTCPPCSGSVSPRDLGACPRVSPASKRGGLGGLLVVKITA